MVNRQLRPKQIPDQPAATDETTRFRGIKESADNKTWTTAIIGIMHLKCVSIYLQVKI